MRIDLNKFGTILISRQSGKEAFLAFQPTLPDLQENENIEINFDGVSIFSPSWGDEFLRPLNDRYKERLVLKKTNNPSVKKTVEILEEANKIKFRIEE